MTKKTQLLYSIISICAIIAYCGFLFRNSVSEVDLEEETLPYEQAEATETVTLTTSFEEKETLILPSEETVENATEVATETETITGFSPILPVSGEITKKFSLTHTYDPATSDWRAHSGIDIAASQTDAVLATEDGTVTKCYTDPLWGNVIEIDHGEYVSIYKNVSTLIMVKEGDSVNRGEKISGVGQSGITESGAPHLHFEIKHYSEYIDPTELFD